MSDLFKQLDKIKELIKEIDNLNDNSTTHEALLLSENLVAEAEELLISCKYLRNSFYPVHEDKEVNNSEFIFFGDERN